jgi:glycosyltransferase involved in cell wall biosynthesis
MTTSSPDSAHLVGLRVPAVSRREVAWIADFRDPWVRRMSFAPPSAAHRRIQESLEGKVVRRATRVVTTSEATRQDFLGRYPDCDPRRIVVIPNGYDEDDFPRENVDADPAFLILHMGQLNPERPVGPLLDCIESFLAVRHDARDAIRVDLIGPRYIEDEREVARRGYSTIVRFREGVPHREAVGLLGRARVLLLMEQESDRGALILPGKIFEYLRAGRPILGIVPRGAAWDLITRLGAGSCALPSDPVGGAGALTALYDAWRRGDEARSHADPIEVRAFERRSLTGRLAALLDEAAAETHPR